jgi:hypothetical protein
MNLQKEILLQLLTSQDMFGRKCKLFSKIKLGLGLIFGALLGMLTTPKKGKDVRKYLKSDEFKEKLSDAEEKVDDFKGKCQKCINFFKKRFGK